MTVHAVGIDFSERRLSAVAVDGRGAVLREASSALPSDLSRLIREMSDKGGAPPVGIAADSAQRADIEKILARSKPVFVSPGTAAVTAETWVGAAQGARHAICLWVGDRVFAGLVLNGEPWVGAHGLAGSAAWLALNPVERQDYRKYGSLAAEVSNSGIARRLSWRIQSGDHSAVLDRAGSLDAITAADVFYGARNGDGVAISVVRDTAKYLGMAVANFASAIDPEVVVLAGDLAAAGDLLFEPISQECSRRLSPGLVPGFRLELSTLGANAIAIGAARQAARSAA